MLRPNCVVDVSTINQFKARLDKFWLHQLNSTQLNEHVRTQVLTPQCPHLFNTTTYETTRLILYDYTADLTGIGDRSVHVTEDE